jgi:hypothetical protein
MQENLKPREILTHQVDIYIYSLEEREQNTPLKGAQPVLNPTTQLIKPL